MSEQEMESRGQETLGRVTGEQFLRNLFIFIRLLRHAGIGVAMDQAMSLCEALVLVDVRRREVVFNTARALLINRKEDLPVFELVFNRFWRAGLGTTALRARNRGREQRPGAPHQGSFTIANYAAYKSREIEREIPTEDRRGTWSGLELLRTRRFAEMSAEELSAMRRLMRQMAWSASLRRTRRRVPSPHGAATDLRRSLRQALRYGGVIVRIRKRTRKVRARPLVILADISGSMERYSRAVLQFLHASIRSRRDVECFVFGTRLTRLTPQLRVRNVDQAVTNAARSVVDWAGGTRIGDSLHEFNRRWSRRVLRRGAIAVVVSDGLDRGDVGQLRRELRWLRDRSWRLTWLNPLAGDEGFQPTSGGMSAASEYVDDLLPAHNLEALEGFVASMHELPRRRPLRRATAAHRQTSRDGPGEPLQTSTSGYKGVPQ